MKHVDLQVPIELGINSWWGNSTDLKCFRTQKAEIVACPFLSAIGQSGSNSECFGTPNTVNNLQTLLPQSPFER